MRRGITGILFGLMMLWALPVLAAPDELANSLDIGKLPYFKSGRTLQISSFDPSGGNADFRPIEPGKTLTMADIPGAGCISHIWITIASPEPQYLRKMIFRMYWDGEKTPSVECPVGDFFGVGFGEYVPHTSLLMGMTSGGFYSYFPMPFSKGARIEVVNQGTRRCDAFYYHVDYQKLDQLPTDVGRFHAQWHRQNPTLKGRNYTILDAKGRGHFVGCVLSMQAKPGSGLYFLEGDEFVWVDGEKKPSWNGTGTEDYFVSGWYFNKGAFSAPYHGLTIKDEANSRISVYRLHVLDAIPFEKSIKVDIEHGWDNGQQEDYSSVAYWYQSEPHASNYVMPGADARAATQLAAASSESKSGGYQLEGAVEGEALIATAKATRGGFLPQGMGSFGNNWSGDSQLFFTPKEPGATLSFEVPVEKAGRYLVSGYMTKAPDYGIAALMVNGKSLGAPFDGYDTGVVRSPLVSFGVVDLPAGKVPFEFEMVGKNPSSSSYFLGLDAILLQPVPSR